MKTIFSLNDVYPNADLSEVQTVSEQTIPSHEEANFAIDNQTSTTNGVTKANDKNMVFGAMMLLVGLLVVLHFME